MRNPLQHYCEEDEDGHVMLVNQNQRILHACGNVCPTMTSDFLLHLSTLSQESVAPILLIVNSSGGQLSDGLAMVDLVRAFKAPVHSLVMGLCCSAATLFASICDKRYSFPGSFFLIHELSQNGEGPIKYHEVIEDARILSDMMRRMHAVYKTATGASTARIREDLTKSKWLTAKDALAYGPNGLVDKIVKGIPRPFSKVITKGRASEGKN